ncbi:MAG TPA: hypothetical protein VFZ68_14520 [Acidimicrobiales bacterium]
MSLSGAHDAGAWVVVVANGLAGAWALGAHALPPLRVRALWWFTVAAELALVVQVILGVLLVTAGEREAPEFHMFYGFAALAAVGIIYSYRHQLAGRIYLLYGFGGLFLMGMALRAMFIGGVR